MFTVKIGSTKIGSDGNYQREIASSMERAREDGCTACVRVEIHHGDVDIAFAANNCGSGGGGVARKWNRKEEALIEEWRRASVEKHACKPGPLISFLKAVERIVG